MPIPDSAYRHPRQNESVMEGVDYNDFEDRARSMGDCAEEQPAHQGEYSGPNSALQMDDREEHGREDDPGRWAPARHQRVLERPPKEELLEERW